MSRITIPDTLKKEVKNIAQGHGVSMTELIRHFVKDGVRRASGTCHNEDLKFKVFLDEEGHNFNF